MRSARASKEPAKCTNLLAMACSKARPSQNEPMRLPVRQRTVWGLLFYHVLCVMHELCLSHAGHTRLTKTGDPIPARAQHADPLIHLQSKVAQPLTQQGPRYVEQCEVVLQENSGYCTKVGASAQPEIQ